MNEKYKAKTLLFILCICSCSMPGREQGQSGSSSNPLSRAVKQHPAVYEINISRSQQESFYPALAETDSYNGSSPLTSFGAVWQNGDADSDIYLTLLNKNGAPVRENIRITNNGDAMLPKIAYTHSYGGNYDYQYFGIVWQDSSSGNSEIYFAMVKADGEIELNNINVSNTPGSLSVHPVIAWNPAQGNFGVAWTEEEDGIKQIYYVRVYTSGGLHIVKNISQSSMDCDYPAMAWNSTNGEYGVTWEGDPDAYHNPEIYFTRLYPDGTRKLVPPVRLTYSQGDSDKVSLVWNNYDHVYAMVWEDNKDMADDGTASNIWFAEINLEGEISNETYLTSSLQAYAWHPTLVWNTCYRGYGVCWADLKTLPYRTVFMTVSTYGGGLDTPIQKYLDGAYIPVPTLAFNRNHCEYGLISHYDNDVYFCRLDLEGDKLAQGGLVGTLKDPKPGYYYIRHKNSGKYLTHWGGSHGLALREYGVSYDFTQKWRFAESSGYPGYYKIISEYGRRIKGHLPGSTALSLETSGGGSLVLWRMWDSDNNCTYLLRSKYNLKYRIYRYTDTTVRLFRTTGGDKYFEIFPAD
jgi:hypothetical protein